MRRLAAPGQRVAFGEVLDVAQQDGVAQVERGHRAHLLEDGRDASVDRGAGHATGCSTTIAPTRPPVGDHRRDEQVRGVRA